jgi:hypothetical protein
VTFSWEVYIERGMTLAEADTWTIGPASSAKVAGLQLFPIRCDGRYPSFQPCVADDLGSMRVLYDPSVYNGNGTEERVNITMSIDENAASSILCMEKVVRDKLRPSVPSIDAIWNSCIRPPSERAGQTFKCKVRLRGEGCVRCFGRTREEMTLPQSLRGFTIVPVVEVRSAYVQRSSAGLVLEMTACILGDSPYVKAVTGAIFR